MPIKVQSDVKPTIITKPDMRFANTFLSTKYRDYSVPGEAMMDKTSGELFIKRPIDGRVISFSQNKKMLHDLVLELRILLTNNENIYYPSNNNNAFFVSTNYDLTAINNEGLYDLTTDNISINEKGDSINTLSFRVSSDSNGFFCRPTTRDCDKPFIEFLTNKYNEFFKNYSGTNSTFITEKNKFDTIELWEDSNCVMTYIVRAVKDNKNVVSSTQSAYVRLNESVGVEIPDSFVGGDYDYFTVNIINLDFYKIHFMIDNKDNSEFGSDFTTLYEKFIFADNRIEPSEFNIMHFINKPDDVVLLGNEILIAFLDIPYINRYMSKMSKLKAASQFLTTIRQPPNTEWTANTCWAERIRDVSEGGVVTDTTSKNTFDFIESYFTNSDISTISGNIVTDEKLVDDFLLIDENE